jgi:hypothetical protein
MDIQSIHVDPHQGVSRQKYWRNFVKIIGGNQVPDAADVKGSAFAEWCLDTP